MKHITLIEFEKYLESDLNTRYEIHKAKHFSEKPKSTIEYFHRHEIAYLERQIEKYRTKETVTPTETDAYLAQIEMLDFIKSKMTTSAKGKFNSNQLDAPCAALYCLINGIEVSKSNSKQLTDQLTGGSSDHFLNTYNKFKKDWTLEIGRKAKNHIKRLEKIMPFLDDEKQKITETIIERLENRSRMV